MQQVQLFQRTDGWQGAHERKKIEKFENRSRNKKS
jgi:hypothetical protein